MENRIQGWMNDLNMLLSCFRTKMSGAEEEQEGPITRARGPHYIKVMLLREGGDDDGLYDGAV